MRINNNLMAMNTHRQLGINNNMTAKSLEKLSSGFRINRAGDDAAGLAISEKMRGQIRGLNMASKNAQDGISLIQTAEGALTETHAILQRMRELAIQSANDTNVETDRNEIQKEINQLTSEINRIGNTTEFNTQKLLNGAKVTGGVEEAVAATETGTQNADLTINAVQAGAAGNDIQVKLVAGSGNNTPTSVSVTDTTITVTLGTNESGTVNATLDDVANAINDNADAKALVNVSVASDKGTTLAKAEDIKLAGGVDGKGEALQFQIGANENQSMSLEISDMRAKALGITTTGTDAKLGVTDGTSSEIKEQALDVSDHKKAASAVTTIQSAIDQVSAERSKLGAVQNRLEHTIKNLDTSAENLQASESRIRDVDMAKEMMEFTKQNILQQAATAMLAQANQAPQTVLQLLR